MTEPEDSIITIMKDKEKITAAVRKAVHEAVLKHKQAANTIVGMVDDKMVWLKPEEIDV